MIDDVDIEVKAGDGGDGVVSFRREKFVPRGGPDGGNGGRGGDVFIAADSAGDTLREFELRHHFRAGNGHNGEGKRKQGRRGEDIILGVPPGTLVWKKMGDKETLLADLEKDGEKVLIARGGQGGCGNTYFATATRQTPRFAQKGEPGEEGRFRLELKLIADVAIIGYPSVGKSTLLAAVSAARPRIGDYPFTTGEPVLGVVEQREKRFVVVEIPGLIEGAHQGRGLGHKFLRHSQRTRLFIHLLDGSSAHIKEDWKKVNEELALYDPALARRTQITAVNKIDLPAVQARLSHLRQQLRGVLVFFISAATGEGVVELMTRVSEILESGAGEGATPPPGEYVLRPLPRERAVVRQQGDAFVIQSPALEKLIATLDWDNLEARGYIWEKMTRWGIPQALRKAGAKAGDKIRAGGKEWQWEGDYAYRGVRRHL